MGGWMDGWVDGWMAGKARLRIAYSNQKQPLFGILGVLYKCLLTLEYP
jgi:hypothetical protein